MPISRIVTKNGRKYIEHNGKPELFYGIQIRLDDALKAGISQDSLEDYFRLASETGFTCVSVSVCWKVHIEPCVSGGDCFYLQRCLFYAEKYGLSIHWLWFGSNICGSQGGIPDDIRLDTASYPTVIRNGEKMVDVSHSAFILRELNAFNCFLNLLVKYDRHFMTVAIQLENEPDFGNWHCQRNERMNVINQLGLAVKRGPFNVFTRVNLTAPEKYINEDPVIEELLALPGVDSVGVDVYINETSYCNKFIEKKDSSEKNYFHFAELGAHVDILPQLICNTLQNADGCLLYELRTVSDRDYDFGLYRNDPEHWIERDGTQPVQYQWTAGENVGESNTNDIRILNRMICTVEEPLALSKKENITMLANPSEFRNQEICVEFITSQTGCNAFGMAIYSPDSSLYLFTMADEAWFTIRPMISGKVLLCNVKNSQETFNLDNGRLKAEKGKVYIITIT